jgi:ASC-1-like (ASCH) protein
LVAECGGEIQGVAGATPKKGDPIKLMPLLASTEEAFEALIVDLQGLLADYGHKLYVHLVPQARQVVQLQRHGWGLEGVFPGGYAPDSVVQQWGLNIRKEGSTIVRNMRIKRPYYDAIMAGRKTVEVRVGYDSIRRIKANELIQLSAGNVSGVVRVTAVRRYDHFRDLLNTEGFKTIVPQVKSEEEALRLLQEIYPAEKEALGVYAFQIEKAN